MRNRRGQTILEYTAIIIIILGVVIGMKDYLKRGIQGRWKSATDNFGDQYDPQHINSSINYSTQINAVSQVDVLNGTYTAPDGSLEIGQWTNRLDMTNTWDTKTGFTQVGD